MARFLPLEQTGAVPDMHWPCYEKWEQREEFLKAWRESARECDGDSGWVTVFVGEACTVRMEIAAPPEQLPDSDFMLRSAWTARVVEDPSISVWLHHCGTRMTTSLEQWESWLEASRVIESELVRTAWEEAQSELRSLRPYELRECVDQQSVLEAIQARLDEFKRRIETEHEERSRLLSTRNEKLAESLKREPDCPHCGAEFAALKYYDNRTRSRRSCVICQSCGRSSRHEEFEGEISF